MLIPDDNGVLHIAILAEISPPVARDVAEDVHLNLYTKYVPVCFQVLKTKVELVRFGLGTSRNFLRPLSALQSVFDMCSLRIQVKCFGQLALFYQM